MALLFNLLGLAVTFILTSAGIYCPDHKKILWSIAFISFLITAGNLIYNQFYISPSDRIIGTLIPFDSKKFQDRSAPSLNYLVGAGDIIANFKEGQVMQPIGDNVPFWFSSTKNGLDISAIVYGFDGRIVAEILHNRWQRNPPAGYLWNFDKSAIEIIDHNRIPVFQFELLNPNRIKYSGLFKTENTSASELYPEYPKATPVGQGGGYVFPFQSVTNRLLLVGNDAFICFKTPSNAEKLKEAIDQARAIFEPWFDYSDPSKFGVRLEK